MSNIIWMKYVVESNGYILIGLGNDFIFKTLNDYSVFLYIRFIHSFVSIFVSISKLYSAINLLDKINNYSTI
jgi:hypothetical protein